MTRSWSALFVVLAGSMGIVSLTSWSMHRSEVILSISDCVTAHWTEYEDRTGKMPSSEIEREWYSYCLESFPEEK